MSPERAQAFDAELQRRLEATIGGLTMQLTAATMRAEAAEMDCRQLAAEVDRLNGELKEWAERCGPANTEDSKQDG